MSCTKDEMIREAITEKKLLMFDYDGFHRIVEPHVYGRKNNEDEILAYQTEGQSSSEELGWRRMSLNKISNMQILDKKFPGKRDVTGNHSVWDVTYCIVD